jgi:hypothetical protein
MGWACYAAPPILLVHHGVEKPSMSWGVQSADASAVPGALPQSSVSPASQQSLWITELRRSMAVSQLASWILSDSCIESTSTIFTFLTSFPFHIWPPLAWPVFHSIAYKCIRSIFHMWADMCLVTFWTWLTSLKMMVFSSIHLPADYKISFFFEAE